MKKLLFIICITCVPHFTFANTDSLSDRMEELQETGIENAGNPQILAAYNKLNETINKRENLQTEYLSALSDNADAMKENEQRIENKILGATGIAAIGIGGMQLASGLSEQNADQDAETAMRAYLSTFSCDYNDTQSFTGGETNITLPAINLIELKSEYLTLATSLKERKNALELPLGIESQKILDSATAGLYDDISTGKSDGAFTSLSAALMSPSGTDATEWAAQKEASSEKIKTGATLAGVGAVASIAGNLIINKDAPKERSNEISLAIAGFIEDNRSQIRYNSPVTRIIFEKGEAKGVILKNGEKIFCDHIIANCSPTDVFSKMMKSNDVPVTAVKRTNARSFGARGATIYLGLNRSASDLGIENYNTIITETADSSVQYDLMRTLNSNNTCIVSCPNTVIPDYSPKGTSVLTFTTLFTENCWANVEPDDYFNEKDNFAKRIISVYENSTGIKISDYIEEIEIATPLTFARYLNTPQGVIYGYSGEDWDGLLPRFMLEESDNDTKGLRFCGGWGTQLSGFASAISSGRNTAYATLNDIAVTKTNNEAT